MTVDENLTLYKPITLLQFTLQSQDLTLWPQSHKKLLQDCHIIAVW